MEFSHIDSAQHPTMVDVSDKACTQRSACAESRVYLGTKILASLQSQGWNSPKGPIIDTAIIAATMAAKKTSELIPFCHPLALKSVKIQIEPCDEARLRIVATVKVNEVTGVEMEALTAASVAALTLYDMCKAASKAIVIEHTRLLEKTGGKSDYSR
jgi:cyclic pyranopterin phosphate synthase